MADISNRDDLIDSRDIIARVEELEGERESLDDTLKNAQADLELIVEGEDRISEAEEAVVEARDDLAEWDDDNGEELKALQSLVDEAEGYAADWQYGATLIREDYFTEYAMEMMQDIGDLPRNLPSYIVIDEEATADNLKVDYTEVDYDGVTYLVR